MSIDNGAGLHDHDAGAAPRLNDLCQDTSSITGQMDSIAQVLEIVAVILLLGAVGEFVFSRTGIPDVLWLVCAGVLAGPVFESRLPDSPPAGRAAVRRRRAHHYPLRRRLAVAAG